MPGMSNANMANNMSKAGRPVLPMPWNGCRAGAARDGPAGMGSVAGRGAGSIGGASYMGSMGGAAGPLNPSRTMSYVGS